MKPLLKPSSHSNLYYATMRSASFGLPSRNQITRVDLRERVVQIRMGAGFEQWLHGNLLLRISVSGEGDRIVAWYELEWELGHSRRARGVNFRAATAQTQLPF